MSTERTPLVTDEQIIARAKTARHPFDLASGIRAEYEAELASKDADIEALRNPWISVKDRLPIKERWVIVVADGAMNCAWYDKKRGWHNGFNERPKNIRIEEITHWVPLPTPPKP